MIGQTFWDIEPLLKGNMPKVNGNLNCPICGGLFYFKHAFAFRRLEGEYRIDIAVKCSNCALVLQFGVHITEKQYKKFIKRWGKKKVEYKDVGHNLIV